jgi:hypothetical protein
MPEAIVLQVKATLNNAVVAGLTLSDFSFYLYAKAKSGGAVTTVVNGANAATADGGGAYSYTYSDPNYETYNYFGHAVYGGASNLDGKLWEFSIDEPVKDAIDRYDFPKSIII